MSSNTSAIFKKMPEEKLGVYMTLAGYEFIILCSQIHITWDALTSVKANSISPLGMSIALICQQLETPGCLIQINGDSLPYSK
jgi:hypothetical protein